MDVRIWNGCPEPGKRGCLEFGLEFGSHGCPDAALGSEKPRAEISTRLGGRVS